MRVHVGVIRCKGQTPIGIFTNLWPTALSRSDRADGLWYLNVHVGPYRLEVYPQVSR